MVNPITLKDPIINPIQVVSASARTFKSYRLCDLYKRSSYLACRNYSPAQFGWFSVFHYHDFLAAWPSPFCTFRITGWHKGKGKVQRDHIGISRTSLFQYGITAHNPGHTYRLLTRNCFDNL